MKLFFDGGYRPSGMETAVVLRGEAFIQRDLGPGSSIDAEWLALVHALRIARDHDLSDVVLLGDCIPVIDQAKGIARCRGDNIRHLAAFHALAGAAPPRIRYIRRTQNLAGIALARQRPR